MAAVVGLSIDDGHHFSKRAVERVTMVAGVGIEGDVHAGPLVQHRSRVRVDPNQPNLRQVHLIDDAVFAVAASAGFEIDHGDLGENVTVSGLDVHGLAVGTMLRLGESAFVAVTGLRNPCGQINGLRPGLLDVLRRADGGDIVRRAGIMGVVVRGGEVARR